MKKISLMFVLFLLLPLQAYGEEPGCGGEIKQYAPPEWPLVVCVQGDKLCLPAGIIGGTTVPGYRENPNSDVLYPSCSNFSQVPQKVHSQLQCVEKGSTRGPDNIQYKAYNGSLVPIDWYPPSTQPPLLEMKGETRVIDWYVLNATFKGKTEVVDVNNYNQPYAVDEIGVETWHADTDVEGNRTDVFGKSKTNKNSSKVEVEYDRHLADDDIYGTHWAVKNNVKIVVYTHSMVNHTDRKSKRW